MVKRRLLKPVTQRLLDNYKSFSRMLPIGTELKNGGLVAPSSQARTSRSNKRGANASPLLAENLRLRAELRLKQRNTGLALTGFQESIALKQPIISSGDTIPPPALVRAGSKRSAILRAQGERVGRRFIEFFIAPTPIVST
jgi:hypothetical protein